MTEARIVQETSLMSWMAFEPLAGERQSEIYNLIIRENRAMTAREICYALGQKDMNYVRPRITELYKQGRLRAAGRIHDPITNRTVLLWEPIKKLDG